MPRTILPNPPESTLKTQSPVNNIQRSAASKKTLPWIGVLHRNIKQVRPLHPTYCRFNTHLDNYKHIQVAQAKTITKEKNQLTLKKQQTYIKKSDSIITVRNDLQITLKAAIPRQVKSFMTIATHHNLVETFTTHHSLINKTKT